MNLKNNFILLTTFCLIAVSANAEVYKTAAEIRSALRNNLMSLVQSRRFNMLLETDEIPEIIRLAHLDCKDKTESLYGASNLDLYKSYWVSGYRISKLEINNAETYATSIGNDQFGFAEIKAHVAAPDSRKLEHLMTVYCPFLK